MAWRGGVCRRSGRAGRGRRGRRRQRWRPTRSRCRRRPRRGGGTAEAARRGRRRGAGRQLLGGGGAAGQRARRIPGASPDRLERGPRARLGRLGKQWREENKRFALVKQRDAIRLEESTLDGKLNTAAAGPKYKAL